jgi:hypothetical protein
MVPFLVQTVFQLTSLSFAVIIWSDASKRKVNPPSSETSSCSVTIPDAKSIDTRWIVPVPSHSNLTGDEDCPKAGVIAATPHIAAIAGIKTNPVSRTIRSSLICRSPEAGRDYQLPE